MAADLEKLAQYHAEMGNQPRANFYLALAAEERVNGVPETLASVQQTAIATKASVKIPQSRQEVTVFTRKIFHDYLHEELKARGQEIALPEPSQVIVEVHNILAGSGFDVAPMIYFDRKKKEVTYGVIETVIRPDYTDGTQMYYSNPDEDPLAQILVKGRVGRQQRITVDDFVEHVPTKSRFAVSWNEVHNFVFPEVVDTFPHLKEQVIKSGIIFRVPTKAEFQSSGERYPHFGSANSWEWLYNNSRFGNRLFGGGHESGGLKAVVHGWWMGGEFMRGQRFYARGDDIAFRVQAVLPSQKLP